MNLVTEPWIPVILRDGTPQLVSLLEVFTSGDKYADLAVRPHERIALMRLLICIAQAALDGPETFEDWQKAPERLPFNAERYLNDKLDCFELFVVNSNESAKPFLQVTWPQRDGFTDKLTPLSKLDIPLASGNNSMLFDHYGLLGGDRCFTPARIALILLAFQNYAQGGGISAAIWTEKSKNFADAPCKPSSMLHSFIRGENLFSSICLNLLTKFSVKKYFGKDDSWGVPIWDKPPSGFDDFEARKNATETYLGRLVPLSRLVKLKPDCGDALISSGYEYPRFPEFRAEPSATVIINQNDGERKLLGAGSKAIWRELPALIVSRQQNEVGGALTLSNVTDESAFDIWVGALLIHPRKTAEVLDSVEAVFHIPVGLITDSGRSDYDDEIKWSEKVARRLSRAVETYRENFDGGWKSRVESTKPQDRWNLKDKLHSTATRHYWTAVEKLRPLLMAHMETFEMPQETLEEMCIASEKRETTQTVWRKAVRRAAYNSYRLACGQETPRQIKAFALGWEKLVGRPIILPENNPESETEHVED